MATTTNLKAILDAIAAGPLLPATLNATKPTGAESIRKTYAQAPDSVPSTPCLLLLPQEGEVVEAGGATYSETHNVDLWFVYTFRQGDLARAEVQRQLWLGPLIAAMFATAARVALIAAAGIKSALIATYSFDTIPYSGQDYPGIRFRLQIVIRDIVVPS